MEKEISKGTQKFLWHMVSFVAVFIIALVVLCRFLPEPYSYHRSEFAGKHITNRQYIYGF